MANEASSKFQKSVDRARGTEGVAEPSSTAVAITSPETMAMVTKATKEDVAAITSNPDLEFAPQLLKLEEGDMVHGILEGNGPVAEFEHVDKATKEVTHNFVQTWIIRAINGGQRVSILSSAQLDRKLAPFVGGEVKIVRGRDINTSNGQRVTDYLVAGPKLPTGPRSWATKPAIPVIDAKSAPAQLPAGNSAAGAEDLTH
jgi:hypothetical protein